MKEQIRRILKLVYWPLLILVLFIYLLIILENVIDNNLSLLNLGILLVQLITIIITIIYRKKAFWYIFNQFLLVLGVGFVICWDILSSGVRVYLQMMIIIGGIIVFSFSYLQAKKRRETFIARCKQSGKIKEKRKMVSIELIKWPALYAEEKEEKIKMFLYKAGIPLIVILRITGVLSIYSNLIFVIGEWAFFSMAGIALWRVKWVLDWQKECDCTIKTEFAEYED